MKNPAPMSETESLNRQIELRMDRVRSRIDRYMQELEQAIDRGGTIPVPERTRTTGTVADVVPGRRGTPRPD